MSVSNGSAGSQVMVLRLKGALMVANLEGPRTKEDNKNNPRIPPGEHRFVEKVVQRVRHLVLEDDPRLGLPRVVIQNFINSGHIVIMA